MSEPGRGSESLGARALSGTAVTLFGQGAQSVLQIGILVILARLITPEDFGLLSAAMVVVTFCNMFVSLGLGPALVQRSRIEQTHIDTAFFLSLILGAVMTGALLLAAPLLAAAFEMERLTNVLRVLAVGFIIMEPGVVSSSLLARKLRFGTLALLGAASYLLGYGVVGVTLAAFHRGVWALVFASLAQMAFATVGVTVIEPPPVHLRLGRGAVHDLLGFGTGYTLGGVAGYFAENLDNMIVGRLLGAQALGYYGRAFQFLSAPAQWLGVVSDRVFFPVLSRLQLESDRLGTAYRRTLSLVALGAIPMTVLLVLLAPEIVQVILGPNWTEVILPFQILSLGMLPRTSSKLAKTTARATGVVYASAWRQALFAVLVGGGAWLGHYRGLPGVAVGVVVAAFVNYVLMGHLTVRSTGLGWVRFLSAHQSGMLVAAVWLLVGWPSTYALRQTGIPDIVLLIVVVTVLLLVFVVLSFWRPQLALGRDGLWVLQLLKERSGLLRRNG